MKALLGGLVLLLLAVRPVQAAPPRPDVILADFEGVGYGGWRTTGTAFGTGPAQGTLPGQMPVSGYRGHGLASSFVGGDAATGTLTSPVFTITRRHINFLIGGGRHPGAACINLLLDGRLTRTATGPNGVPGGTERLNWASWDVADLEGKAARIQIVDTATGGWGHINVDQITQSDKLPADEGGAVSTGELYQETYRPQFHFSAKRGWLNDPNGLVFHDGEYHLYFQFETELSGADDRKSWGFAVSPDLVHWRQLDDALQPDALGPIWSGSAVVDRDNTSGLGSPGKPPLVALYTAAGGKSPESSGRDFTQCLAYSLDRGRTWTRYAHNPILPHIAGENRDPKVVWHAPTKHWIMALYLEGSDFALFASPDLKAWTRLQTMTLPGCDECPDFFEMPVSGSPNDHRWVFTAANGKYLVGTFDGQEFTPETGVLPSDYGANFYAVQTYSDIPRTDGRRIQIAWMRGGEYPQMPFNQQMSFPCELTLHRTSDGLRLHRQPVREIAGLYGKEQSWHDLTLAPGENPLHSLSGDLWDENAEFEIGTATAVVFRVRGTDVLYDVKAQTLTALGRTAPLKLDGNRLTLRLLIDRTSLEVFGNGGQVSMATCFLPPPDDKMLAVHADGGSARIVALTVHPLRSAWR